MPVNFDDLLFPLQFGIGIANQNAASPLSGTNYDNPFLQSIVQSNRGLSNQLLDSFQLKTSDDVQLTEEDQSIIDNIRRFQGDKKADEALAKLQAARLEELNAPIREQGMQAVENFPAMQGLNSLFELQQMEETENRFAQKNQFGDLSDFEVASNSGFFEYGGPANTNSVSADIPQAIGYLPFTQGVPVQTELGETVFIPDTGDIVPTNATKRHTGMDLEEVTDYLPENSYVFSKWGFKLSREDAEDIIVERDLGLYNAFGKQPVPQDVTLDSIFKSKEESPADLVNRINNKFEILEEEDLFTQVANNENKVNRLPYLYGVMGLSEINRPDNEFATAQPEIGDIAEPEIQSFGNGGVVRRMPFGGIALGLQALGTITGLINNRNAKKDAQALMQAGISGAEDTYAQQSQLANTGLGATLMGLGAMDTTVDAPELSTRELEAIPTSVPQAFTDYQSNRLLGAIPTRQAFQNAPNLAAAMNSLSPFYAEAANASSQTALQAELDRMTREAAKLQAIGGIRNQNIINETNAGNQSRDKRNAQISGAAGAIAGNTTTQANLLAQLEANKQAARTGNFAAATQLNNQFSQSLLNAGSMASQLYYMNQNQPSAVVPQPMNMAQSNNAAFAQANSFLNNRFNCPPGSYSDGRGNCIRIGG
jgi:hypothetical protein